MQNLMNRIVSSEQRFSPIVTSIICTAVLLLSACATPLKPQPQPESQAFPPGTETVAWESLRRNLPAPESSSWFSIFDTGTEDLRWRLAMIDTARVSLDLQYFLWLEDAVGALLFERLLLAADRGVRVRLLVDDSFLSGEDPVVLALDVHPNVDVRIFNPYQLRSENMLVRYIDNLNDFGRTNHRMHNKLIVADTEVAIVGGRNIADEYFGFGAALNFRDFGVITTGAVVPVLASGFDSYWNSGWAFPVTAVDQQQDSTDDLNELRQELLARDSILTNSLASTNHVPAHAAFRHHRKQLIEAGAELHVFRPDGLDRAQYEAPGFMAEQFGLHGKVLIFDDDRVYIGTLNLDPRSMVLNTEMGLLIHSPAVNAAVREAFAPNFSLDNSWRVEHNEDGQLTWRSHDGVLTLQPAGGFWRRVADFFYGLFPIDSQM
jgi:phosphatidylserine/phosphatidylglycerophosphate/cardiolipin synthase-like enzyme